MGEKGERKLLIVSENRKYFTSEYSTHLQEGWDFANDADLLEKYREVFNCDERGVDLLGKYRQRVYVTIMMPDHKNPDEFHCVLLSFM